jgi:hypothetical protein
LHLCVGYRQTLLIIIKYSLYPLPCGCTVGHDTVGAIREEFVVPGSTVGLTLDFWGRIEHFLLMKTVNPVQFYPINPGLNIDPGSTNSSRITPQDPRPYSLDYSLG